MNTTYMQLTHCPLCKERLDLHRTWMQRLEPIICPHCKKEIFIKIKEKMAIAVMNSKAINITKGVILK